MPVEDGFKAWQEYGFAGLFVVVFIFLLYEFRNSRKDYAACVERMATVIERASALQEKTTEALRRLEQVVEDGNRQSAEYLSYLKARDAFERGGKHE